MPRPLPDLPFSLSSSWTAYPRAIALLSGTKPPEKGARLRELDAWMHAELGAAMRGRGSITKDELLKVLEWKLLRGKNRPFLPAQVRANPPALVEQASKAAFEKLSSSTTGKEGEKAEPDQRHILDALKELCVLKGVGPATASAILTAHTPSIPFMSDESLTTFLYPPPAKIAYTHAAYVALLPALSDMAVDLNEGEGQWTAGKVERAVWAGCVLRDLGGDGDVEGEGEGEGQGGGKGNKKRGAETETVQPKDDEGSAGKSVASGRPKRARTAAK
ncbi:uncharacterized protein EV422DRAFT_225051 [Fimicolochytrium jonesii]|uniref:uncharacterized protein n=1 Tax=Fimicolochytrium jonesii TaxID=1396493 RepID=UPI0022FE9BD1|nr:uncharacterized protein EV422DRAFT_225051 [Fimicolochytrium jonesii]KAI8817438.1 hypothetical protein EV422DRAFT_225051 [Fimicolochytrium jonesii]